MDSEKVDVSKFIPKSLSSYITNGFAGWMTTVTDSINNLFFGGSPTVSIIVHDKKLSTYMTSLFTNTKINVMIYVSKNPNAYTFPGVPKITKYSILLKLRNISAYIPIIGQTIFAIIEGLILRESFESATLFSGDTNVSIDKSTGKIKCDIKEVTCYISTAMIDLLRDDNEALAAVILLEVGHNLQIVYYAVKRLQSIGYIALLSGLVAIMIPTAIDNPNTIPPMILMLLILFGIGYIFFTYAARRQEIIADEFAIRCGYGNALARALRKLHAYLYDSSIKTKAVQNFNFVDRILHFFMKIGMFIYNQFSKLRITNYPDMDRRENMITLKTLDKSLLTDI